MDLERKPDGLNILDALFRKVMILEEENRLLKEALQGLSSRIDTLTFNIDEKALNMIAARTLNIQAQVLLAATKPVDPPAAEEVAEEEEEAAEEVAAM